MKFGKKNARLHRDETKPSAQVTREIQSILRRKLAGLDTRACDTQHPPSSSAQTYLSLWFDYIQFENDPET